MALPCSSLLLNEGGKGRRQNLSWVYQYISTLSRSLVECCSANRVWGSAAHQSAARINRIAGIKKNTLRLTLEYDPIDASGHCLLLLMLLLLFFHPKPRQSVACN